MSTLWDSKMTPLETYLYEMVESWLQGQDWDGEDSVATAIAETNSIFNWTDYDDIKLTELDNSHFMFNATITLSGEPRKEDVLFCGDTIHVFVEGRIEFDIETEAWEMSDEYEVGAAVKEWREEEDLYFDPEENESTPTAEFERRIAFLDHIKHPMPLAELFFLMQHHGIPTRLLDWTTNSLVALYFALSDETQQTKDACIWIMDPRQLNRSFNAHYPAEIEDTIFIGKDEKKVVAICAAHTNTRMNSQRAEFTIHMNYTPLDQIKEASVALRDKILIPHHLKAELKEKLRALGGDRSSLFPDLDNIAKAVVEDVLGD
jgi:hypothetical protein